MTYWEKADLLAFLYVLSSCVFVTFPNGVPGQVWYLILYVSIPDLCLPLNFVISLGILNVRFVCLRSYTNYKLCYSLQLAE